MGRAILASFGIGLVCILLAGLAAIGIDALHLSKLAHIGLAFLAAMIITGLVAAGIYWVLSRG